jgi:hypothetical protein
MPPDTTPAPSTTKSLVVPTPQPTPVPRTDTPLTASPTQIIAITLFFVRKPALAQVSSAIVNALGIADANVVAVQRADDAKIVIVAFTGLANVSLVYSRFIVILESGKNVDFARLGLRSFEQSYYVAPTEAAPPGTAAATPAPVSREAGQSFPMWGTIVVGLAIIGVLFLLAFAGWKGYTTKLKRQAKKEEDRKERERLKAYDIARRDEGAADDDGEMRVIAGDVEGDNVGYDDDSLGGSRKVRFTADRPAAVMTLTLPENAVPAEDEFVVAIDNDAEDRYSAADDDSADMMDCVEGPEPGEEEEEEEEEEGDLHGAAAPLENVAVDEGAYSRPSPNRQLRPGKMVIDMSDSDSD